ncbi:MAG: response regulator [Acidobacteriota bacterium]|nr:response regulator [Acidobacteriota bacterium]
MKGIILVVEDYEDTRECMKILIQGYGYQVVEAADGFEAIKMLKAHFPDLVLMDMSMPLMDGIEATLAIRKLKRGAEIPIIAVTAHGKQFYEKAIEAGCSDLIAKPVDFDSLEALLNQYLEH